MVEELENEIAAYECETGRQQTSVSTASASFSGYTASLITAVTKLMGYLKEVLYCLLYGRQRTLATWSKSCTVIGYPHGQDGTIMPGWDCLLFTVNPYNKSFTCIGWVCLLKMVGYWPHSFSVFMVLAMQKKELVQNPAILPQTWPIIMYIHFHPFIQKSAIARVLNYIPVLGSYWQPCFYFLMAFRARFNGKQKWLWESKYSMDLRNKGFWLMP